MASGCLGGNALLLVTTIFAMVTGLEDDAQDSSNQVIQYCPLGMGWHPGALFEAEGVTYQCDEPTQQFLGDTNCCYDLTDAPTTDQPSQFPTTTTKSSIIDAIECGERYSNRLTPGVMEHIHEVNATSTHFQFYVCEVGFDSGLELLDNKGEVIFENDDHEFNCMDDDKYDHSSYISASELFIGETYYLRVLAW